MNQKALRLLDTAICTSHIQKFFESEVRQYDKQVFSIHRLRDNQRYLAMIQFETNKSAKYPRQ